MSGMLMATGRIKSIQRAALAMLVVAGMINYVDRATLAVANPLIREDLGLSIADMGYLLSAFLWAYAFAQLPTGAMVDRLGPRILLTCGLSLWSLAQVLGGFVRGFGEFFGARILLGIGEAPQFPTCARVVRDWFNPRDRGLATGIFNCASSLGTAIAVPLLTFLMLYFGCIYLTWIYTAWLPGYLEIERHMSVKFTGWAAAVPFAWGVVGGVTGGFVVDLLVRRGVRPIESRKYPAAMALLGTAACTVAAAYVTSDALAIAFISAALFLVYLTSTCAWALSSVAAPTNCTASIGAMQNFGGYLGGALAPTVTGLIVQSTGTFVPALVVGALIAVASAGSYLFIVDAPITAMDMDAISDPGAAPLAGGDL